MKSKFLLIFLLSLFMVSIEGCIDEYDDGPFISFRSVKNRALGTWDLESLSANGNDSTPAVKSQQCYSSINIKSNDQESFWDMQGSCYTKGEWDFTNNKATHLYLLMNPSYFVSSGFRVVGPFLSPEKIEWYIKKLTNKQLWIETDYQNVHWVAHLNKD